MRYARPALTAIVAEARKAIAFAALFTVGAGLSGLALPIAIMHAIEAAERRSSLDALAIVACVAGVAVFLRAALLSARDRILLQAALWLCHTAGSAILADRLERGVMPEILEADRMALDRCTAAISGQAVASGLDALAAIVPLTMLFLVHPALGTVSLLVVAGVIAAALIRARAAGVAEGQVAMARAGADRAWRMAAANGPMIAMRHMAGGIVADWETLSRASVVASYGLARPARRAAATLRAVDLGSCLLIASVGVWLVLADSLALAGLAAAIVLQVMLARSILSAHDHVPELAGLEAALQRLVSQPAAMANRPLPGQTPPTDVGPEVAGPQAVRPRFDPAPLPQARPPAVYASPVLLRGGI